MGVLRDQDLSPFISFQYPEDAPLFIVGDFNFVGKAQNIKTILAGDIVDNDKYNSSIYPGAIEVSDNGIDEDCDGMDDMTSTTHDIDSTLRLYPNPATMIVYLPSDHRIQSVYAVAIDGRITRLQNEANKVDISGLDNGLYAMTISYENGLQKRVKIMIVR